MEELNNNNLSLGIDLGITSVGWSVVDLKNNTIVTKGVYSFVEGKDAKERRDLRGKRRRGKRKNHRIERIYQLLENKKIYEKNTIDSNLLETRNRAIKERVSLQDIVNIICYFARHRGYIPFEDETRKSEIVDALRNDGYIACEIQKKIYSLNERYRGNEYLMQHSDYVKELNIMLEKQKEYYLQIDDDFISKITDIINSKRKFWEGPGGPRENQLTRYGRYKTIEDIEKYKKDKNYNKYLFEQLIGKCSVYKDEKKSSMWNYYAEYFNFYNDIVNLRIDIQELDETNRKYFELVSKDICKLTKESIQILKNEVLNSRTNYKNLFKKCFNVEFDKIFGYKKDKNGNEDLSRFKKYKEIKRKVEDDTLIEELLSNMDAYNKAVYLIQISPDEETRYEILKDNLSSYYSDSLLRILSGLKLENKYHNFSEKALKVYLKLMEEHNENSSFIERKYPNEIMSDVEEDIIKNYKEENIEKGNLKYINDKYINDIVASPTTKKALRKAIDILNKIFCKYGYPAYICIENTREILSTKKQREYEAKTLENQAKRRKALNALIEQGEYKDENDIDVGKKIDKYLLLEETGFKCAFCGKEINVRNCEIEHILPKSKTADDTFLNKTVSCTECNTNKNDRTPFEYRTSCGDYENFKEKVINGFNMPEGKKANLLFEKSIDKYEKKFKNSNLNDTAYATNELANQLNLFKKAYSYHNYGEVLDFKILKIPGQFTSIMRKNGNLEKNREYKYHHAVDATIVACIPNKRIGKLIDMVQNYPDKFWKIENLNQYRDNLYNELYLNSNIKEELEKTNFSNTKIAQEVVKKENMKLFDADISKVIIKDGNYYKIEQINNIYEITPEKFDVVFNKDKHFLCKDNNRELYDRLFEIVDMYKGKKVNPFVEYCKENKKEAGDFDYRKHGIRQSKNKNSSVVIRLRFLSKVNNPYLVNTKKLIKGKKEMLLMYDNVNSYCTRIYKDKENGKFYFMPIYKIFIDNNSGKIREDLDYYKKVYDEYVGKDSTAVDIYMDLFNNEYVRFEDNKGNVSEGLVKGFDKANNVINVKKCNKSINSKTVKIEKIKYDVLGIYNFNI